MDIRPSFPPDLQSAETVKPCQGSLYNPTCFPQSAPIFSSPIRNQWPYPSLPQFLQVGFGTVGCIRLKGIRPFPGMTYQAMYGWNLVNQRNQSFDIVNIRPCLHHRQRDPVGIRQYMVLGARLATICGIWPCFQASSHGSRLGAVRYRQ